MEYTYFLYDVRADVFKIGKCSSELSFNGRINKHNAGNPGYWLPITIIEKPEKQIHQLFEKYKKFGKKEIFHWDQAIFDYLEPLEVHEWVKNYFENQNKSGSIIYSDSIRAKVRKYLLDEEKKQWSNHYIANQLNTSDRTVRDVEKELYKEDPSYKRPLKLKHFQDNSVVYQRSKTFSIQEKKNIVNEYLNLPYELHISMKAFAQEKGISRQTLRTWILKFHKKDFKSYLKSPVWDHEKEIKRLSKEEKVSRKDLAIKYKCSTALISRIINT